jgi:hypothetical protein
MERTEPNRLIDEPCSGEDKKRWTDRQHCCSDDRERGKGRRAGKGKARERAGSRQYRETKNRRMPEFNRLKAGGVRKRRDFEGHERFPLRGFYNIYRATATRLTLVKRLHRALGIILRSEPVTRRKPLAKRRCLTAPAQRHGKAIVS